MQAHRRESTPPGLSNRFLGLLVLVTILSIAGCSQQVTVQAQFDNTNDIEDGSPVYYQGEVIGDVANVELTGTGSTVTLQLDADAASRISGTAAVVVNRVKQGTPLEIFSQSRETEAGLEAGQELEGLDSMLELGAWMVADAIDLGAGTVAEYVESFQDYLQSDEFADNRALVEQQIKQTKEAASSALSQMQKDFESATRDLGKSEQTLADAMRDLGDQLAPLAETLAGSSEQLADELQQFAEALEQNSIENQQLGEEFLAGLLETLERLNQSMEKGAEQPDE